MGTVKGGCYPTILAQNVLQELFPEIEPSSMNTGAVKMDSISIGESEDFKGYDGQQVRMMDEACIILSEDDEPIGRGSKRVCHLMTNINRGLLHRAFSCFLFDSSKRLLLQKRAQGKITFPSMWTNTCCSHPLDSPEERGLDFESAILGAKKAAQRKLKQELGIRAEQVPLEKFEVLTRVQYKAGSDGKWGEHEMDYILFIQADVEIDINRNEIQNTCWVTPSELSSMIVQPRLQFTPWFKLICETMLFEWWKPFGTSDFGKFKDEQKIRRM